MSSTASERTIHELRNALNRVMGSAQLLDSQEPLSPKQKKHVERILQASQEILSTLEGRPADSTQTPLKLNAVVVKQQTPGTNHDSSKKILLVDDDPEALDNYQQMLPPEFDVVTALGGDAGLTALKEQGPFSVVVSDMRMPGMSGIEFLAHTRETAPDMVRMMLTGHADANVAIEAVNHGHIFRFLTKPCDREVLRAAVSHGLLQHQLVVAEKGILENTLMGGIKVLTEVLSAVSPEAFGRSLRITKYVKHFITKLRFSSPWHLEAAAMLSQLGCITLDPNLLSVAYTGTKMSTEDHARFDAHPKVTYDLLARIPRLESVAWMIGQQLAKQVAKDPPETADLSTELTITGARILKLAVMYDSIRAKTLSNEDAITQVPTMSVDFDRELLDALKSLKPETSRTEVRKVPIKKLSPGMILQQEIKTRTGLLVVSKGQEVTRPLITRLENFSESRMIESELLALVPV